MIDAQVGVHPFEPFILDFQLFEPTRLIIFIDCLILLPFVEGGGADLMLAV